MNPYFDPMIILSQVAMTCVWIFVIYIVSGIIVWMFRLFWWWVGSLIAEIIGEEY